MSTSNAMRQGICMSFVFLFISAFIEKKFILAFMYFVCNFYLTSGPFYLILYFAMLFVLFGGKFFKPLRKNNIIFLSGLLLAIVVFYLLSICKITK